MIEANYAVTFEYDEAPPVTVRGRVRGSQAATCARIAAKDAAGKVPGARWRSLVVLLDRSRPTGEGD